MAEKETRNFALRNKDGNKIGVFTRRQASQAAMKAANRGVLDVRWKRRSSPCWRR